MEQVAEKGNAMNKAKIYDKISRRQMNKVFFEDVLNLATKTPREP